MPPPVSPPPEFFVDRSVGEVVVPSALRATGYIVHTLRSLYGERIAQTIDDEVWLRRAGGEGWIVLVKDKKIRRRPHELQAIRDSAAKVFCLTSGSITGQEMANIVLKHANRMVARSRRKGPFIYALSEGGLEELL